MGEMMEKATEFSDKGVVITGATGIIGRWLAKGFAARGARLCLSDKDGTALKALAADLPGTPLLHTAELTEDKDLCGLVARVASEWGAPDILINNAAIYPNAWLLDTATAEWDRIMSVNVRAPFALTRDFARLMVKAGRGGSVLNISSGASRKMRVTAVAYCLSKTALDRLTKGFALELASYGIRVNALEPGFAPGSESSPLSQSHIDATTAAIPAGRLCTEDDVVNAALYLSSEAASYVTGTTLTADGGESIGSLAVYQRKKKAL